MNPTVSDIESMTASDGRPGAHGQAMTRDHALFAAFLGGDNAALVALFDRHNDRLFRYCLHLLGDAQRAEDITQELWERLMRLRASNRLTADNPAALLLRIVRNLCLDDRRRAKSHLSIDAIADEQHPSAEIPELTHLEEIVLLALPHLPEDQREILMLHEYAGYGYEEIAAMLDDTTGAVRTRAWRARAHLGRVVAAMLGMRRPEDER